MLLAEHVAALMLRAWRLSVCL